MNKPCEYCGADLPQGVDERTRRVRSHHFSHCPQRPVGEKPRTFVEDLLLRLEDAVEALDGTSVENEKLVDEYRAWRKEIA